MSGLFISIEGTDGSGKTTQIRLLEQYFKDRGFYVVCTREPGGNMISEKIRELIIDKENTEMTPVTEALLYAAARAQHVACDIMPVLNDGGIVISDRFLDSSLVYQGCARGLGIKTVKDINKYAVDSLEPDITFFLRLKPGDGIERKKKQKELDRMESENEKFHRMVYGGYMQLARRNKKRIKVIDALKSIDDIHREIVEYIERLFEQKGI
ncbi:MAG: dTMP kinase [Firmicutes bacterium]|nr:dTMP kinase [Bacillota bacterium]